MSGRKAEVAQNRAPSRLKEVGRLDIPMGNPKVRHLDESGREVCESLNHGSKVRLKAKVLGEGPRTLGHHPRRFRFRSVVKDPQYSKV
jgi:hypothetical protein